MGSLGCACDLFPDHKFHKEEEVGGSAEPQRGQETGPGLPSMSSACPLVELPVQVAAPGTTRPLPLLPCLPATQGAPSVLCCRTSELARLPEAPHRGVQYSSFRRRLVKTE